MPKPTEFRSQVPCTPSGWDQELSRAEGESQQEVVSTSVGVRSTPVLSSQSSAFTATLPAAVCVCLHAINRN